MFSAPLRLWLPALSWDSGIAAPALFRTGALCFAPSRRSACGSVSWGRRISEDWSRCRLTTTITSGWHWVPGWLRWAACGSRDRCSCRSGRQAIDEVKGCTEQHCARHHDDGEIAIPLRLLLVLQRQGRKFCPMAPAGLLLGDALGDKDFGITDQPLDPAPDADRDLCDLSRVRIEQKDRGIPARGAAGAAVLQDEPGRHTIARADEDGVVGDGVATLRLPFRAPFASHAVHLG